MIVRCHGLDGPPAETVASLIAQTFQQFEIVLVHDATDLAAGSVSLVRAAYPRSRVIDASRTPDQAFWNLGISESTGRYLCFLAAADTLAPESFERSVGILNADASVAFVEGAADAVDDAAVRTVRSDDVPEMLSRGTEPSLLIVRRTVVQTLGGFDWELRDSGCEELDLRLRMLEWGHQGIRVPGLFRRSESAAASSLGALRRLMVKHAGRYRRHLFDLLRHGEAAAARTLAGHEAIEREIDAWLVPQVASLRSELARLRRKLGAEPAAGDPGPTTRPAPPGVAGEAGTAAAAGPWHAGSATSDIAVVIVCCNAGRTLSAAIESVFAQTRPAAEIVIVDEASTDIYTAQVLASVDRSRLRLVRAAARGPGARNQGILATTAPYLLLVDADALLRPTCLERIGAWLDGDQGIGFASCATTSIEDSTRVRRPPTPTFAGVLSEPALRAPTMFRRSVWESAGRFDEACSAAADLDFWLSALEKGFHGAAIDEPLVVTRSAAAAASRLTSPLGARPDVVAGVWQKHRHTIDALGPELLVAREGRLRELTLAGRALERRRQDLQRELSGLQEEVQAVTRRLREQGRAPLDWGDFRRLAPFSPVWGCDRGKPLDRVFIERFLARHREDIHGHVLEVKDPGYTRAYGSARVTKCDVVDIDPANTRATISADLSRADGIASDQFDCFILTQTLHIIYDVRAVLSHACRILKPGGVLLCTVPAVSRVNFEDGGLDGGDYWRFTEASIRRLFAEAFPADALEVTIAGNLLTSVAFLYGLSPDEIDKSELDHVDPWFPLLFCVRAVKPAAPVAVPSVPVPAAGPRPGPPGSGGTGLVLLYHRVGSLSPDTHGLCIDVASFRAQLEYLNAQHRPVPLDDLAQSVKDGRVPERALAVTFDDSYAETLEVVVPLLSELGIPATFFAVTEHLERPGEFWWDTLEHLLLSAETPPALELALGGLPVRFETATAGDRAIVHKMIHTFLLRASLADRVATIDRLVQWNGRSSTVRASYRPISAVELRKLATQPGMAIGAHSVHHLHLPSQPIEIQRQEINGSKTHLERVLGRTVTAFAYPYGASVAETAGLVRAAGFALAVTAEDGVVRPGIDPWLIPRLEATSGTVPQWAVRVHVLLDGR